MASLCAPSNQPGSAQAPLRNLGSAQGAPATQSKYLNPGSAQGSLATRPPVPLPPRDECAYCKGIPTVGACIYCHRWFCCNCIDSWNNCWDCAYSSAQARPGSAQGSLVCCCLVSNTWCWGCADASLGSAQPDAPHPGSAQGCSASSGSVRRRARSRSRSRTICYIPPPPSPPGSAAARAPTIMELRATAMELRDENRQLQHVNELLRAQSDILSQMLTVYEDWVEDEFGPGQE